MKLDQFFFNFFNRARSQGLALALSDFEALMEAVHIGIGMRDKLDLLETCQLLWAKNKDQAIFLATIFYEYCHELDSFFGLDQSKSIDDQSKPISNAGNTGTADRTESKKLPQQIATQSSHSKSNREKNTISDAPMIKFYSQLHQNNKIDLSQQIHPSDTSYIDAPFILTDDYLPITQRQLQQLWRKLQNKSRFGTSDEINWKETTEQIAKERYFANPVFNPTRKNQTQVLLIVDTQGSMIAHEAFGHRLVQVAELEGNFICSRVYYTQNVPERYAYKASDLSQAISIDRLMAECNPHRTVALIYSDAGASRGLYNEQRVISTKKFLGRLQSRVHNITWLNPMPKERWGNTSAELISLFTQMFECTDQGIDAAIKVLKTGNHVQF